MRKRAVKRSSSAAPAAPAVVAVKPKKKGAWWMLHNSGGKKDVALTLMVMAFMLSCFLAALGALGEVSVGNTIVSFNEFNMGFATVVLVPLIGLYFGRRYTDTQRGLYDQQALYAPKESSE